MMRNRFEAGGGARGFRYTDRPRSAPFPASTSIPTSTILRWIVIALLIGFSIAMVSIFGALQARDERRRKRIDDRLETLTQDLNDADLLAGNLTAPPNCTLLGNATAFSIFPDDLFTIFSDMNPGNFFQFDLSGLLFNSTVVLTTQNGTGTVALLGDIPPITTVFEDDEFRVLNAADQSKEIRLNVGGVTASTIQVMTVQNSSGIVAYLSDLPTATNTFLDDVFAVQNAGDPSREVMLDVSQVSPSTTQVMSVQPLNGTIAYLADIPDIGPTFPDNEFEVKNALDAFKTFMLDCSIIATQTVQTMTVQDTDGTIAYLSDLPQIVEVMVTTSRVFPDIANEGVATLEELGDITKLEISLCGGGGGGGTGFTGPQKKRSDGGLVSRSSNVAGGGGGSGSGYENFPVLWATQRFFGFNVTIGSGGAAAVSFNTGGNGGRTNVLGISKIEIDTIVNNTFYVNLDGYGGGGGGFTSAPGDPGESPALGGSGGGNGGSASTSTSASTIPGIAGDLGGYKGGLGGSQTGNGGKMGAVNYPWRAGGGGGGGFTIGAGWFGSYSDSNCDGCGASSMFGGPGTNVVPIRPSSYCAGGNGGDLEQGPDGTGSDGGDGAALFRYYLF